MAKNKILDAAEKLFVEKGFDGTSVRELAQNAGVNIAMISYYFGAKENLLEAIMERKATFTKEKLKEFNQNGLSAIERLDQMVDYYVELLFENRKFNLMMNRELTLHQRPELHERIIKMFEKNWKEIRTAIAFGQAQKVFKTNIDVELVIMTMFGLIKQCSNTKMIENIMGEYTLQNEEKIISRIKRHLKNLLHDYLIIKK